MCLSWRSLSVWVCVWCFVVMGAVPASAAPKSSAKIASPAAIQSPQIIEFESSYPAGMIVIRLRERRLYLTLPDGKARRYVVAVGKEGKAWRGETFIKKKYIQPAWMAPASVRRDNPSLPRVIAGGAPNNPMGARALELNLSEIAIHGTAAFMRASIGSAASYGCIRMLNEDIIDLYERVQVGTKVVAEP